VANPSMTINPAIEASFASIAESLDKLAAKSNGVIGLTETVAQFVADYYTLTPRNLNAEERAARLEETLNTVTAYFESHPARLVALGAYFGEGLELGRAKAIKALGESNG
jgi:hypothetical protein